MSQLQAAGAVIYHNCQIEDQLIESLGSFNAMRHARLYDELRLGKEGAKSRYHLNYLL